MVLRKLPGRSAVSMLLAALTTAMLLISCAADANSSSSDTKENGGGGSEATVTAVNVSASPATMTSATGTSTITATVTGDDSAKVSWSITSGSDYASLGSESTTASGGKASVTLTGKNSTTSEQSVTVKAFAGNKFGTVTVKVPAAASADTSKGITSVTLNRTTLSLLTEATAELTATVETTSADIAKTVTWTSSNESVATVSDGTVTAVAAGNATITAASTVDPTKKATCAVTVESANSSEVLWRADEYEAQTCTDNQTLGIMTVIVGSGSVSIDANSKSIDGYLFAKRLKFGGSGSTSKNSISFTTTGSATITVYYMSGKSGESRKLVLADSTGAEVTSGTNNGTAIASFSTTSAVAAGTYYIYSAGNGINVYAVKIAYESAQNIVYPSAVSLSESTLSLDVSDDSTTKTATLTATIENASEVTSGKNTIEWTSSNTSVATVSNGVVIAKKAGTATITASCTYGGASATCAVTVTGTSSVDLVVTPGAKVTTYGWADLANDGAGMSYPDTDNIIYIGDDGYKVGSGSLTSYTSSLTKRMVFTNAIASGSVSSSSVNTTAAIIVVSGTVDLGDGVISDSDHSYYDSFDSVSHARNHGDITYEIGSNKAIIGVNSAKIAYGGLYAKATSSKPAKNIIIQNVIFWDAHGSTEYETTYDSSSKASIDNLVFEATFNNNYEATYLPHNIWIDHCVFTDGTCEDLTRNYNHDGSLDVKAAQYMTISYCEFTNHDKVTLLAPNENYTKAEDRQITFHHNYYHGAIQRMPRSRGCQVHIYNNYYNNIGTSGNGGYTLGPGINSQFIVENNNFGTWYTSSCLVKYFDGSASGADTLSKFYQSGNNVTISNSNVSYDSAENLKDFDTNHNSSTKPWIINYDYSSALETASGLSTSIPNAAGTDKSGYTATVSVNGVVY